MTAAGFDLLHVLQKKFIREGKQPFCQITVGTEQNTRSVIFYDDAA